MMSGMKVGWLVVGAVSVLSLAAIAASGPATLSLLDDSASRMDDVQATTVIVQTEPPGPQPTVVRLQPASSAPSPGAECRPCTALEPCPGERFCRPFVTDSEPKKGERFLRLLFPDAGSSDQEVVPELAAPPVPLPGGLLRR